MNNHKIGLILIIIGIIIASSILTVKLNEDKTINKVVEDQGTCYLADGTCLHETNWLPYILGWTLSAAILALGAYLVFFEKSQKAVIATLEKQKQEQTEEEKFSILLRGLDQDERRVINAVKGQNGITQDTLRIRTDLHKSKLSILLDRLEKKDLIKRVEKGKTKQVFLKIRL